MTASLSPEIRARLVDATQRRLLLMGVWVLTVSVLFADTLGSMVHTWLNSETFTHGIVVAPISLWLAWRMRDAILPRLHSGPAPVLLLAVLPLGLAWLAGQLVSVQLVMQLAYVGILIVGLAALLGVAATRQAVFPLAFLFLAVPMGIGLEQPMMDLTAKYTVQLIQLTGIPVYQEGRFFQLPTGSWSVVEACSGVRYLIASFTLGLLYAHLSYRSLGRKLAFVAASIAVPIVANVLRAYLIVMLGHLSNMQLATGVDHLIYGWIFFGVVMLLLFWVGGWWAEDQSSEHEARAYPDGLRQSADVVAGWRTLIAALGLAALAPTAVAVMQGQQPQTRLVALPSQVAADWGCSEADELAWTPRDANADRRVTLSCGGTETIGVVADQFLYQEQGREVADYYSGLKGDDENRWRILSSGISSIVLSSDSEMRVQRALLRSNLTGRQVLAMAWYLVDDAATPSAVRVKVYEALHKLTGEHRVSSRIFVVTDVASFGEDDAQKRLADFLAAHVRALNTTLSTTESRE